MVDTIPERGAGDPGSFPTGGRKSLLKKGGNGVIEMLWIVFWYLNSKI